MKRQIEVEQSVFVVRCGSRAAGAARSPDVGLSPDSGGIADVPYPPLGAITGLMHRSDNLIQSPRRRGRAAMVEERAREPWRS